MSSPRFSTSFHCKQVVFPSQMGAQSQNCWPSSELSYRSPKSTSSSQEKFKSFQDPTQKTYSGDILLKHAHYFTQEKPFTPRTLKTDCKPSLANYRYYTSASRKGAEEKTPSKYFQPDTHCRRYNITGGLFISGLFVILWFCYSVSWNVILIFTVMHVVYLIQGWFWVCSPPPRWFHSKIRKSPFAVFLAES